MSRSRATTNRPITWLEYLESLSGCSIMPDVQVDGLDQFLSLKQSFHSLFSHCVPVMYLADYTSGRYLTISPSSELILGYKPDIIINDGMDFLINQYQQDDLRLFNYHIFPDRLQFLKTILPAQHAQYIFSHSYRLRNSRGKYVNFLQRNTFIKSDAKGNPLLSLGMIINIDHFKTHNLVVQVIEKLSPGIAYQPPETVFKKAYYLHEEDQLLSKREKEVLLWLAEGLVSKQIADKLFISEKTVVVHRKNMLHKTNTKNVAELVAYTLRKQII